MMSFRLGFIKPLTVASMFCLMLTVAFTSLAQERDFSAVDIKTHKITDTIYMLEGAGGNIGVSAGEDGVFLVDDQYAPLTDKIVAAIEKISDKDIRFLINTHIHPDHTGGNENFGKRGVIIVGHDNIRSRLQQSMFGRPPLPDIALPIITFNDTVTFHMNGEAVRALKLPSAHTDGDTLIHFQGSDVIHAGDVFRTTTYPYIDKAHGGSFAGMLDALALLIEMAGPNTKVIPGHGVIADRDMVETFRTMLVTIKDRMMAQIQQGKTLEEVMAANITEDYDARWAPEPGGFFSKEAFISLVYEELQAAP
jgi:glyoxylase-like metal-dependent hydrolase (beta-lactamase superfamily II)